MSFSPLSKNAEQIDEKWTSASCSPTATNDKRLITTVRVVVHNVEHLKNDKFALALNHWSIYLLIPDAQGGSNSAVRINMRHIPGTKEWQLVWTNHAYTHPYSALIWWDWKLTGTGLKLCPKDVEQFLLKKGFDQFEGECDSEQGCRWWVLKTIELFAAQGWIEKSAHIALKPRMLFCYLDKKLATEFNFGLPTKDLPMTKGKFGFEKDEGKGKAKRG